MTGSRSVRIQVNETGVTVSGEARGILPDGRKE